MTQTADTPLASDLIRSAAAALEERKEEINRLNVFPVPDGDTGTNMSLTMQAVIAELDALPPFPALADVCKAVTHGSLMGARGNSGVILSQMLRGLCEVVGQADSVDADLVVAALKRSVEVSFQAVRKPVEGTMLTVLKDMHEAASSARAAGADLDEVLDAAVRAAFDSVRRGPDLLPVLKEHGVVDAGGFGLAILAEGFVTGLEGHEFSERDIALAAGELTVTPVDDWDDQEYLYCTEFLLHGADAEKSFLEEWISSIGGSELVVGDRDTYKIHVHTDRPGDVLSWATSLGEVSEVHINNMRRQTAERSQKIGAEPRPAAQPSKPFGFVAVASGDGIAEILRSLGVDKIVNGGQTMNPSTAEIAAAVSEVDADAVIILPNNKNIVMAAQQAVSVSDRPIGVVPTTSVPECFAALLAFDPHASLEENVEAMAEAASAVVTAEVTTAVKDAKSPAGDIKKGQVIGIADHEIVVIGEDVSAVGLELIRKLSGSRETLTVLAGEGFSDEDLEAFTRAVSEEFPHLEIDAHRGGQPLYPLVLGIE
ncbi:MAG: DAK2 domain-containing protein [Anaerosomatales bacterium]|nr:DAK2 domain-containing protein [Anaerosomatales bacterium]